MSCVSETANTKKLSTSKKYLSIFLMIEIEGLSMSDCSRTSSGTIKCDSESYKYDTGDNKLYVLIVEASSIPCQNDNELFSYVSLEISSEKVNFAANWLRSCLFSDLGLAGHEQTPTIISNDSLERVAGNPRFNVAL